MIHMVSDVSFHLGLSPVVELLISGSVLLLLVIIFGVRIAKYRRGLLEKPVQTTRDFGIDEVDKLYRQGLISDEEFAKLRRKTLGLEARPEGEPGKPVGSQPDETDDSGEKTVSG